MRMKQGSHIRTKFHAMLLVSIFWICAAVQAGPAPMPLICSIDTATQVFIGTITDMAAADGTLGTGSSLSLATAKVQETLKGPQAAQASFHVVSWKSAD